MYFVWWLFLLLFVIFIFLVTFFFSFRTIIFYIFLFNFFFCLEHDELVCGARFWGILKKTKEAE